MERLSEDIQKIVDSVDYDTKLAITTWVISKIDEFGNDPGSFRHLIYGLMEFGYNAYGPLYTAGGMNITNELDYSSKDTLRAIIEEEKIESIKLKHYAGICDEPGCFNEASCGWPTKDGGYRRTCSEHYNRGE